MKFMNDDYRSTVGTVRFTLKEFGSFRMMLTPILLRSIYFGLLGLCVIVASLGVFRGLLIIMDDSQYEMVSGLVYISLGIVQLAVGPIVIRLAFEMLILPYRINETLTEIKNLLEQQTTDLPGNTASVIEPRPFPVPKPVNLLDATAE